MSLLQSVVGSNMSCDMCIQHIELICVKLSARTASSKLQLKSENTQQRNVLVRNLPATVLCLYWYLYLESQFGARCRFPRSLALCANETFNFFTTNFWKYLRANFKVQSQILILCVGNDFNFGYWLELRTCMPQQLCLCGVF